jgi:adenine-specific DNA-methyltransferase
MDNGWSKAIQLGKLPEGEDKPIVLDMDPAADPVLFWAGKRNRRDVPILPLQRNEIVSESRIARIIDRAMKAAEQKEPQQRQGSLFADLEKTLREADKKKRVEFFRHEEGWRNKLICGDSLHVMESLIHYENLRGKVQMIYIDPPYGIKYDSNFQQRVDSTKNDEKDQADDVLTIKAFRDTWALGVHSYLSYLEERLYLCRELLSPSGSVFIQMGDENVHLVRTLLDEVFGRANFLAEVIFSKTSGKGGSGLDAVYDVLLWYAKEKENLKYQQIYMPRPEHTLEEQYTLLELKDGTVRKMTIEETKGLKSVPAGSRRFMPGDLSSQGASETGSQPFEFEGSVYELPPNTHWKTSPTEGLERLADKGRLYPIGRRLRYRRYSDDFPWAPISNVWSDTVISGFASSKLYAVQTSPKVVERCLFMTTDPGDLVFDPTCGSGTTVYCAEKLGRRWITCDTSRVAINVARKRLLSGIFEHYKTRNGKVSGGFVYRTVDRITLKSLAYDLEPEKVDLVDQPEVDRDAIRVTGPFDVMSLGRYSLEDWKGYVVAEGATAFGEPGKLENYIEVICRLYRKNAAIQNTGGLVHAVAESETEKIAISVGPLSGRVTAKQINDAVQDALASGILEVHILGWAFEANVGEVKSQLESRGKVKIQLIMIRPDTLAEGLKATQPEMLFSPLALPDITVKVEKKGKDGPLATVTLKGLALFDRKTRTTEYRRADSGYVSVWYLDEDYDGDCFVDCQAFFDFKKAPNLKAALKVDVDKDEFTLKLTSEPFPVKGYNRVAVKLVDVYGNESTVVQTLA